MTMVSSGPISLAGTATSGGLNQSIEVELQGTGFTTISLNDSSVRNLVGVPSGTISLSNAYGKSYGNFFVIAATNATSFPTTSTTPSNDSKMAMDSSGNTYTVVTSTVTGGCYIVKVNVNGTIGWCRSYSMPALSTLPLIALSPDDSTIYLHTYANGAAYAVSINTSTGNVITNVLNNETNCYGRNMVATSSGLVLGIQNQVNTAGRFAELRWYNTSLGITQRQGYISSPAFNYGYMVSGIQVDSSGNVYFAMGLTSTSIALVKVNSSGAIVWTRGIPNCTTSGNAKLAMSPDGNRIALVTWTYNLTPQPVGKCFMFDSSGNTVYQVKFNSVNGTDGCGIVLDSSYNAYILLDAYTATSSAIYKLDSSGNFVFGTYASVSGTNSNYMFNIGAGLRIFGSQLMFQMETGVGKTAYNPPVWFSLKTSASLTGTYVLSGAGTYTFGSIGSLTNLATNTDSIATSTSITTTTPGTIGGGTSYSWTRNADFGITTSSATLS